MPFDSNGVFSRVMNWTSDQQNGIAIECGRHDAEDNNFAEGFNETFCRDGRAAATGNFNLGNHKIQNLAEGIAATDAVTKGQLDASSAAGVSLNTPQTITGEKTFTSRINYSGTLGAPIRMTFTDYDMSVTTNNGNHYLGFYDKNNNFMGGIQSKYTSGGNSVTKLMVRKQGDTTTADSSLPYISIYYSNDVVKTYAPTPSIAYGTASYDIVNCSWANTYLQAKITGGATSITGSNLTKNRVLVSNSSGKVDVSDVTATELGYLDGVTSSIQSQINAKAANNAVVKLTGNQVIDGVKRFSENILTDINATRNVAPSTTQYGGIGIRDNANNLFASMVASMDTSKNAAAFLRVFNPSNTSTSDAVYMSLHYNADGSTFVTAPASDVNTSIVTTINKSKAANGYFQLGNGLIINWGTDNGSGSRTIRFSKSFTSTNYKIVGISHGNSYCVVDTSSKTTSTVSVGNSVGFDWIAIGY